jgi:hypothetical protein
LDLEIYASTVIVDIAFLTRPPNAANNAPQDNPTQSRASRQKVA